MRHTFPSIGGRKVAYTLHSDTMALLDAAYRTARALCPWFGWYETYGDGTVQHSHEMVVTLDDATDALASLATAALADSALAETLASNWPTAFGSRDMLPFLASVRPSPSGKATYYSPSERKTTTSDKARYDKRYWAVPNREDDPSPGGLDWIWALVNRAEMLEHVSTLVRIETYVAIRDYLFSAAVWDTGDPWHTHFKVYAEGADSALRACQGIVKSVKARHSAMTSLRNYGWSTEAHVAQTAKGDAA